jgi:hypothetical protein
MAVSFRQNGVGPNKTCANAILPKGHVQCSFAIVEWRGSGNDK